MVHVGFDGYAVSPGGLGKYFIREISTHHGHRHPRDPIQSLMTWCSCFVKTFYLAHTIVWARGGEGRDETLTDLWRNLISGEI